MTSAFFEDILNRKSIDQRFFGLRKHVEHLK